MILPITLKLKNKKMYQTILSQLEAYKTASAELAELQEKMKPLQERAGAMRSANRQRNERARRGKIIPAKLCGKLPQK